MSRLPIAHPRHSIKKKGNWIQTELYDQILDRVPAVVWDTLAKRECETWLCYCRDGWFCHTHVIIAYAVKRWPERFQDGRRHEQTPTLF